MDIFVRPEQKTERPSFYLSERQKVPHNYWNKIFPQTTEKLLSNIMATSVHTNGLSVIRAWT